jgi:AraC-like DNA-binding protein
MIVFDYRPPSPDLREYVRQFQIVGFEFKSSEVIPWKAYWPRPENCLTFYPRDIEINVDTQQRKFRSTLIGQPSFTTKRQVGRDFLLFQTVLQPGALFRLTGMPAHELTNHYIDAETVFSNEIRLVNERLSSTDCHLEMIGIVENFLRYLVKKSRYEIRPVDKAGFYLLEHCGRVSFDWLASESCLSRKQFYRKFVERMGVSPKYYSRIIKFDYAVKLKNVHPEKDWLSIALELDYYDYQHLTKDFLEFTGLTPNAFHQMESRAPERAFGHKET